MVDDFYNRDKPNQDLHTCNGKGGCQTIYNPEDRFIDPSSGRYSASRWNLVRGTMWAIAAGCVLVVGGFVFNMSGAFIPAATIFSVVLTANAGVYWASTRKDFKCEGEQ